MIHKLISEVTATAPSGLPTQDRLFRVPSGPFAGRLVALLGRTPSFLATSRSDPPHADWTVPADFVADAADEPFAATMDGDGHLYVAYTQQSTGALCCLKLVLASGAWATQTPVTVYQSATSLNRYPSILKDLYNRIWISWTSEDAGVATLRVKKSIDDGQVFGTGSSDAGADLSGSVSSCAGRLTARGIWLHALFTADGTTLTHRRIQLDAALWDVPDLLYTGTGLGAGFRTAVSPDGVLGVLFAADTSLFLKEYDGAVWGGIQTVTASESFSPALTYLASVPTALFLRSTGAGQFQAMQSNRSQGVFVTPQALLPQLREFASVLCYDADAGTPYADLTAEAQSQTGADVSHPVSGGVLAQIGDAVCFGGDEKFSLVRSVLSTAGIGGSVTWSYWNGTEWMPFVPASGAFHFDSSSSAVRLFTDTVSSPADWQKLVIEGRSHYWIRAFVDTAFTTPPIGSQFTSVPDASNLIPLRG